MHFEFLWETWRKLSHGRNCRRCGYNILKMPLNKSYRKVLIWFMLLRIGARVVNRVTNQRFPQYSGNL
jgi:hypothetical protein